MLQINARQMAELKALLATIGLDVKRKPKPRTVDDWKPRTAGGRACKANMKFWASWPKAEGIKNYQVRGSDNQWYSEWQDGFTKAVEWQKLCYEWR
jgi:hypothetical protein